ncbi:MAG: pseudaminic acid cytidylyltransferase [Planctomycetes bacterium]|nr:pseudaminic acid cytidylyltransferase [Planctomycetota bacterium]
MNLCVIPARGGSKRIPRKNVKEFYGKPMIAWSIEAALESRVFDRIIVSTDDAEIAEVAKNFGAEVPFWRPAELSGDYAGTIPVIAHAIERMAQEGTQAENVCCVYATAPFIQSSDIRSALEKLHSTGTDYVFTVTSFPFPIQRAVRIDSSDRVSMFFPEHFNTRSQDLEEAYHDAGQFYWGKVEAWLSEKRIFTSQSSPFVLPRYRVQDIDTPEDWTRVEWMFKAMRESTTL